MYRLIEGNTQQLPDVLAFVEALTRGATGGIVFDRGAEIFVTRAPGRLDVMGGIADYSGSLVLQLPTREATIVALQPTVARELEIVSLGADARHRSTSFHMHLDEFENGGSPISYEEARQVFKRDERSRWAAYAAGAFLVLMRERGARYKHGAKILISSQVPEGKGVSSSAALEVSVMKAACAANDIVIAPRDLALLCQKVENLIVGAPCGVMDQMTSVCGQAGKLLALLCQPAEIQGFVPVPEGVEFWGLDSGVRHAVSGSDYSSVRCGTFMGREILRLDTYLANVSPAHFMRVQNKLPSAISGRDFLKTYKNTGDPVTTVDPERIYPVRKLTAHPVFENFRIHVFAELLNMKITPARLKMLGELMCQSHQSYTSCGLGSEATDELAWPLRIGNGTARIFGAKITGGGSGGTVALLTGADGRSEIEERAKTFQERRGHKPYIFSGSSPGAEAFGFLRLKFQE
ncbi:MAG TPA: GHMP kinase [Planctomycetota bacterium]|nr:GHMP kinase [Planctomycetota bacterium]